MMAWLFKAALGWWWPLWRWLAALGSPKPQVVAPPAPMSGGEEASTQAHERAQERAQEIKDDVEQIETQRHERRQEAGGGPAPDDVLDELDLPPLGGPATTDAGGRLPE